MFYGLSKFLLIDNVQTYNCGLPMGLFDGADFVGVGITMKSQLTINNVPLLLLEILFAKCTKKNATNLNPN